MNISAAEKHVGIKVTQGSYQENGDQYINGKYSKFLEDNPIVYTLNMGMRSESDLFMGFNYDISFTDTDYMLFSSAADIELGYRIKNKVNIIANLGILSQYMDYSSGYGYGYGGSIEYNVNEKVDLGFKYMTYNMTRDYGEYTFENFGGYISYKFKL